MKPLISLGGVQQIQRLILGFYEQYESSDLVPSRVLLWTIIKKNKNKGIKH